MPTMTASTSTLTPEETTLPSTRSARKAVLPNRPNGNQHEAGERRQLELDQGDEELDRQDEEGEQHHDPGEQQHDDLDEVLEEADIAHQAGDRRRGSAGRHRGRPARRVPGRRRSAAEKPVPDGLQPETGKALEDDAREVVPVADDVGEDADEQRLLDQPRDDVLVRAPRPEQRRERDVDGDQRGGEKADFAAEQAEAGIDVAGEDLEEMIDDAGAAHRRASPRSGCTDSRTAVRFWSFARTAVAGSCRRGERRVCRPAEETGAGSPPRRGGKCRRCVLLRRDGAAAGEFGRERIASHSLRAIAPALTMSSPTDRRESVHGCDAASVSAHSSRAAATCGCESAP